jgi:hypothetical protein
MTDAELNKDSAISMEPQVPVPGHKPSELQQINTVHYIFKIQFNIIPLYMSTPSSYFLH